MPHTLRTFLESIDNRMMHIHDEVDPVTQVGYLCSESRGPLMFHNLTGYPDWRLTDILIKDRRGQAAAFAMGRVRRVVALDVSPQNVEHCRMRGVNASVGDFTRLDFADGSFDGAYAFNSFLHVPRAELEAVVAGVRRVLRPEGHLLMASWGGRDEEGRYDKDWCIPPRFFSFLGDAAFEALTFEGFDVLERRTLDNETEDGLHTQVLVVIGLVAADLCVQARKLAGNPGGIPSLVVVGQKVAGTMVQGH